LNLPRHKTEYTQRELFPDTRAPGSMGAIRYWLGDFFEEATARITGARRLVTDSRCKYCPDLHLHKRVFLESKGVGNTGAVLLYRGRVERDRNFQRKSRATLLYCIWRHTAAPCRAECMGSLDTLRSTLATQTVSVMVVPFELVESLVINEPARIINTRYGRTHDYPNKYGEGWRLPYRTLRGHCTRQRVAFGPTVYGRQLGALELCAGTPGARRLFDGVRTKLL
jgi:hypothetical protein